MPTVEQPPGPRSPPTASEPRPSAWKRFVSFFHAHPIVCLAILTPGIPEYLSTSSPLLNIVVNPGWFFLQLLVNVGQYTAGALLIREAVLRWQKGWATTFLLALAYGITEEGLGDNTLFNSNHGADGVLGSFGRFAGVNWVWSTGVLSFHVIYSIGLPLLLLGLTLPETRGKSLLGTRGIRWAFVSLIATTSFEAVIVYGEFHFWMGTPLLVGSLAVIATLVAVAYRVRSNLWNPSSDLPTGTPLSVGAVGFSLFPVLFFLEYFVPYLGVPAPAIVALEVVVLGCTLEFLRRRVGRVRNEFLLVNLAFGFVLWQCAFGLLLTLLLFYDIPLVIVAVVFFVLLRGSHAPAPVPTPPAGALGI